MKRSPWAKLTISSTPNTSANPDATSAREDPTTRPLRSWMIRSCIGTRSQALIPECPPGSRAARGSAGAYSLNVTRIELRDLVGLDGGQQLFLGRAADAVDVNGLSS